MSKTETTHGPLARYRTQSGMTPGMMLVALGISRSAMSRIDNGRQWPSQRTMQRIKAVTNGCVTADSFVGLRPGAERLSA